MKQVDEGSLSAWHAETHRRQDSRLIQNRYFQGTVTGVTANGTGFDVSIRRVGESSSDGNTYHSSVPGYVPQGGDLVELAWRDRAVAHVVHPVTTNSTVAPSSSNIDIQFPLNTNMVTIPAHGALPANYVSLKVRWQVRTTSGNTVDLMYVQMNGDAAAHYNWAYIGALSGAMLTPGLATGDTKAFIGNPTGGAAAATVLNAGRFDLFNYNGSANRKNYVGSFQRDDSGGVGPFVVSGSWTVSPIQTVTSLAIFLSAGNFGPGSYITTEVV